MSRPPTVYDVAARAGVSIATVSRVLSRPDEVAAGTRARVAEAVDELGYVRNVSARSLAGSRTHVLGLLLPAHDDADPTPAPRADSVAIIDDRASVRRGPVSENLYYDEVVRGAERAASSAEHALLIAAGQRSHRERLLRDTAARVDGLVVVASSLPLAHIERVARRIPVVLLAGGSRPNGIDRVAVANGEGMRALVGELLRDEGIRSVVYVDGPDDSPDARERRSGFDAEIEGRPVDVRSVPGGFSEAGGVAAAESLLASEALPDLIVCANDQSALGVLDALRRAGIDVPGRVRVSGFDGVDAGRFSTPRLTTVRQPMAEIGALAVRMLLDRLGDRSASAQTRVLPVDVLLRESAPPVP